MKIELEIEGYVVKRDYISESELPEHKIKFAEAGMEVCKDRVWRIFIYRSSKINREGSNRRGFNIEYAWRLRLRGWPYEKIGFFYGLSKSKIRRRLIQHQNSFL